MRALFRLLKGLKQFWAVAVAAPLFMLLEVGMDLLQPRLVQHIIDRGIAQGEMRVVLQTGTVMIITTLLSAIGGISCGFFAVRAGYRLGAKLRSDVFRKIQTFSFGNLDRLEGGTLITRLTSDVNQVQEMVTMVLRGMVRTPLLLVGSIVMALLTSPQLSWLFLVMMPVLLIALVLITRRTFPLYQQVQERLETLNTVMQENLAGVRVVKAFVRENYENTRFARANSSLAEKMISAVRTGSVMQPVMTLTLSGGIVVVLWIGGYRVHDGNMAVGAVVAFINYLMQSIMALMMFSNLVVQISRAQASARRVVEILDTHPALQAAGKISMPHCEGRVVFENVSFSYEEGSGDPVLKSLSFTAEPGETVALLGTTGSGKSSLVQLIPRFYDPSNGRVTLDGVDVRDIQEEDLRKHVGIALQESVLFHDTIRANIAMGRPGASSDEVTAAAALAQAADFIQQQPDGYGTMVGQRGTTLSGGQKQRLAIARALLPGYSVLILDDSTSAVDVRTEAAIQRGLADPHRRQQTRLVVAQRISSVIGADKILVIENGRLAGQGNHEFLLKNNELYREIYESQIENGALSHAGE